MQVNEIAFTALDFESAGELPNEAGVPIQIGIAWMQGMTVLPESFFRSYLRTERPVTWAAQQIHAITSDDLKEAPSMLSLWPEIRKRLANRWLVSHGCGTERRYLRVYPLHRFGPWVDTLTLSRKILPDRSSYALSDLGKEFSLEEEARVLLPDFRWHEALSDALASLLLLRKLIALAGVTNHPAEVLVN